MQFAKKLLKLFSHRERWQLVLLTATLIVRAFVELLGVAAIAPFMSVVAEPSMIERNPWLSVVYKNLGFTTHNSFLISMGIALIALLVICNSISAVTQYAMLRFSWNTNHRLSMRLLEGYVNQPYSFFTQTNSSSFSTSLLAEVQQVIGGVLIPSLNIVSRVFVVFALVGLLLFNDFWLALIIMSVLGGAYGVLYLWIQSKQTLLGEQRLSANKDRFKISGEVFGGIKDIKVLGREATFKARFEPASWQFSKVMATNLVIAQLPRFLFETVAFGGIIAIILYYLQTGQTISQILPTISLYAFAGYRLMPELQQLFASISQIRFSKASLDILIADVERFYSREPVPSKIKPMKFHEFIEFSEVSFRYSSDSVPVIADVSLSIKRNKTIGLVGASGSGKTTLVDILLGLYIPDRGKISIDGTLLSEETLPSWQKNIGYVPQHIYLSDDTIANNIAFGVPSNDIDYERIVEATKMAHLHDYVSSLPANFETIVGERGVRLSGGQRQRIGIARALYQDPGVIVMDEATSALDGATENAVMDAIKELAGQKTIVLVAHRMTTIQHCDTIFMLENGRLIASGNYTDLLEQESRFRAMIANGKE